MDTVLQVHQLTKRFRGLMAVDGVTFSVSRGSIVALIGPNGAGKTTIFNLVAGVFPPDSGRIILEGTDIAGLRPHQTCAVGIGRTFQLVRPFAALTVLDNVMIGAFKRAGSPRVARRAALDILDVFRLADKAALSANTLTLPERKLLEAARALATKPRVLLLDEVMAGLRPPEVDLMVSVFAKLAKHSGLTILMTEHVMRAVMALSQKIVVLHHGQKICEGPPAMVARDPQVIACYLGRSYSS